MRTVDDLLRNYQHLIEELTIVTGSHGVFDVEVDDQVLYSKHSTGRHARPGEVLDLFRARLGPDAQPFER